MKVHSSASLCKALFNTAVLLQIIVISIVLLLSACTTAYVPHPAGVVGGWPERERFAGMSAGAVCVAMLCVALLYAVSGPLCRLRGRKALAAVSLAYVAVVQVIWILALNLEDYGYADAKSLIFAADELVRGDIAYFSPSYCAHHRHMVLCDTHAVPEGYRYFSYYPYQAGPLLWYALVFRVFGANTIIAFQMMNAVAITGLVAALWSFAGAIGLNDEGHGAMALLTMTCAPLLMFAAFVYTNAVGFACTAVGFALVLRAFRARRTSSAYAWTIGGLLIVGVGMVFKSTYIIVLIAAMIAMVLAVLANGTYWRLIPTAIGAGIATGMSRVPPVVLERITGQRFGRGMPMNSWIMIGLNNPPKANAGWWSGLALKAFKEADGDYQSQYAFANRHIAESLAKFGADPAYAYRFFSEKLASEWADPMFMTTYYSQLGHSRWGFRGIAGALLAGPGSGAFALVQNALQSVVYALALAGCVGWFVSTARSRTMDCAMVFARVFLGVSFLGGFVCYVFWEAKGIYTLPFYLLLLPVAAYGLQCIHRGAKRALMHQKPGL